MILNKILEGKLPSDVIKIIKKKFIKKKRLICCNLCNTEVSYDEYVDGVGYICYSCMF